MESNFYSYDTQIYVSIRPSIPDHLLEGNFEETRIFRVAAQTFWDVLPVKINSLNDFYSLKHTDLLHYFSPSP